MRLMLAGFRYRLRPQPFADDHFHSTRSQHHCKGSECDTYRFYESDQADNISFHLALPARYTSPFSKTHNAGAEDLFSGNPLTSFAPFMISFIS